MNRFNHFVLVSWGKLTGAVFSFGLFFIRLFALRLYWSSTTGWGFCWLPRAGEPILSPACTRPPSDEDIETLRKMLWILAEPPHQQLSPV